MQKYMGRSCTIAERNELIEWINKSSGPEALDELWTEVWAETDSTVQLEGLSWEVLQDLSNKKPGAKLYMSWKKVFKWSAAAAVLLCLYFVSDWWMAGETMTIYETGYGERMEIVLDDGTEVNLNADSKLSWDKNWAETGIRKVRLEGEAYFDVSHIESGDRTILRDYSTNVDSSSRIPFVVVTSDVTIRVLGTAFNATQRRGKTEIYLESGAVELSLHQSNIQDNNKPTELERRGMEIQKSDPVADKAMVVQNVVRMKPGDWVSYSTVDDRLVQKTVSGNEEKTEWKDGVLSYRDVEFLVMLQNLEDIYGKSFEVNDRELLEKRVNFSVPYEDWNTISEMIEVMLGVKIDELDVHRISIKKRKDN